MIDIRLLRENPEMFRSNYARRQDPAIMQRLEDVIVTDKRWREALQEMESLKQRRNRITDQIKGRKIKGVPVDDLIKEAKELPSKIAGLVEETKTLKESLDKNLMRLPNLIHDSVPYGKDDSENKQIRKWGKPAKSKFELKPHGELAEARGLADFDKAAEIAGRGFNYLKGDLVLLDRALQSFALDVMIKKGFAAVQPPLMMRHAPYEGVTDLGDFEKVMYKIEGEDLYLIATSEHPLIALHMNDVVEKPPIKLAGVSPCFRKEIGARGVDTKGLYRMHQFNKVEQVVICSPEDSWAWHEKLIKAAEEIMKKIGIPYRVVNICTGDIGTVAAKKYDIEAWFPRQSKYGEVVSCSNCTDYQARRLNIKVGKRGGETRFAHTLNSTAVATSRLMVAILENFQQKDGTVKVPKVLQKYMGKKAIGKA